MTKAITAEILADRALLYDIIIGGLCLGVDTLNWKLYRAALADEVNMDFRDPGTGRSNAKVWAADEWIANARQLEGFDSTQHIFTNFIYDISDNSAVVKVYNLADHHLGAEFFTVGGQTVHTFDRTADGWKVTGVEVSFWWRKGNPELIGKAKELYDAGNAPRSALAVI